MYSTSDSLYIITSTGRTLSAGVSKGDKGDGLEYHWDGTRLGVRVENSGDPFVYVDLKGDKGDTGDDGREVELRVDSEMIQWRYVGDNWKNLLPLSALKGEKGDTGPGLEYAWDGTKLGVRVENSGDPFVHVDLKGEKGGQSVQGAEGMQGPKGSPTDTLMYVDDGQLVIAIEAGDTIRIDSATLILADSTGLAYIADSNQLVYSKFNEGTWEHDTIQLNDDVSIYTHDGEINGQRTATIAKDADLLFDMKDNSSFEIHTTNFGNQFRITEAINSIVMTAKESNNSGRRYTSEKKVLPTHTDTYTKVYQGPTEVKSSRLVTDTVGVRMEMANSREVDFLPGKKYFLTPLGTGNYVVWDTIKIEDIGITPADTARWGESGGGDYTLEMNGWETHLRDESGASKGFFQIGGTQGIEVYTEPNNNRYRVGIASDFFPSWSLGVSNNALQLRENNILRSTVGFVGTGGINIQSTSGAITIDGSSISGTQSLSHNTSQRRTTISGGGGSVQINTGSNIKVSLSSAGTYTNSSTASRDDREIVRGGTNNDWIMMSGSSVGVVDRYVSSASRSGNTITLNRTDGIGGTTINVGQTLRLSGRTRSIYAENSVTILDEIHTMSDKKCAQTTTLSQSGGSFRLVGGTGVNISNTSGGVYTISNSGDLVLKTEALNSGTATAAVIYASSTTGTITLPSGVSNGTVKYVINNSGGSKTINRGAGQTITLNSSGAFGFIYYNIWWPMREP